MPLIRWTTGLLMTLVMTTAVCRIVNGVDTDPGAVIITLAMLSVWFGYVLAPSSEPGEQKREIARVLLWSALVSGCFLIQVVWITPTHLDAGFASAGGVLILTLLLRSLERNCFSQKRASLAKLTLLLLMLGACLMPLILTDLAGAVGAGALVNVLIAISPLTLVSVLAEYDYLKSGWFYQNTSFGGLRYDYPSVIVMVLWYCVATSLVLLCKLAQEKFNTRKTQQ